MSSTTTLSRRLSAKSTKRTTARRAAPVSEGRARELLEEIAFVLQAARRISREIKGESLDAGARN